MASYMLPIEAISPWYVPIPCIIYNKTNSLNIFQTFNRIPDASPPWKQYMSKYFSIFPTSFLYGFIIQGNASHLHASTLPAALPGLATVPPSSAEASLLRGRAKSSDRVPASEAVNKGELVRRKGRTKKNTKKQREKVSALRLALEEFA